MAMRKGLGKGLGALIGDYNEQPDAPSEGAVTLPLQKIEPNPLQPRKTFNQEELDSLADSIRMHGIIQPLTVRRLPSGFYQIIAGERRWRAARLAGLTDVPVVVIEADDKKAMELALIENLQRSDLNPIEEAQGLKRLVDEFGLTHETVAKAVGRSRSSISNSLRLLNLPQPVQDLIYARSLEMGHARALLSLPVVQQVDLAQKAAKNGWSVREVERRSQLAQQHASSPPARAASNKSTEVLRLEEALMQQLSVPAEVVSKNQRSGRIVLHFDNPETLAHLLAQLGVQLSD